MIISILKIKSFDVVILYRLMREDEEMHMHFLVLF